MPIIRSLARSLLRALRRTRGPASPGRGGATATIERDPSRTRVRLDYRPSVNGTPDAGEIVWTWVPYAENDGRGKDRPVLIIGTQNASRRYAVKLTSRAQEGDRNHLGIGSGSWDRSGRASWVDLDQLYSVHVDGMRREASALDPARYRRIADALSARFGWRLER